MCWVPRPNSWGFPAVSVRVEAPIQAISPALSSFAALRIGPAGDWQRSSAIPGYYRQDKGRYSIFRQRFITARPKATTTAPLP
jgi:hypothetical protein